MSVSQTVLVFAVVPAAVILMVAALVYVGGARRAKRYRPGRPFDFTPVWFLSAPERLPGPAGAAAAAAALPAAANRPALPVAPQPRSGSSIGSGQAVRSAEGEVSSLTATAEADQIGVQTGGASDRW